MTCQYKCVTSTIGDCPRSLRLQAEVGLGVPTVVATGEIPTITYVQTDTDEIRESYAAVAITLTAQ